MDQKVIVITGGTRGIGRGLAEQFLARGHKVCITGRSQSSVDQGLAQLTGEVIGVPCEAASLAQAQGVWDGAVAAFGRVDIWINNAGMANPVHNFEQLSEADYQAVVNTNLLGVMNGCKVALLGMAAQGHGQLYNFEGFGSDGMITPGLSVYGATKRAVTYFTDALIKENKESPVNVGHMSPGIVITDMITKEVEEMGPERWEKSRRIYNILADKVDTVTTYLVEETLKDVGQHGSRIAWLTRGKAAGRFFAAFVLRRKRDLFTDMGI